MFTGSMVAIVTPMHKNGEVDWGALEKLIEWHIQEGTNAIVTVGTSGESATLSFDEHKSVVKFTVDIVKKRIPVIAGAGANSTAEAVELATSAYHGGCDATLQVTPYYNKPPQRGLYEHFKKIAQAVPLPLILYNVPGRTGCDLAVDTVFQLSKIKNIAAIKEASNMQRLKDLRAAFPKPSDFKIYSGEDAISAEALCDGLIDGVVSVTANVAPKKMSDMMAAGLAGNTETCLKINESLASLHEAMFIETNPLAVKWALNEMGKIESGIRLPLVPLSEANQVHVKKILKNSGLI